MSSGPSRQDLAWLHGAIRTPPFSRPAGVEAGVRLRRLQEGELRAMPQSRPRPSLGPRGHELRVRDEDSHPKTTRATPKSIIDTCPHRLTRSDEAGKAAEKDAAKKKGKP
jgi:hypothetical protein